MAMNALGDEVGMCFALNRSGGRNNIVIIDLEGASTTLEVSASIGIAGELGAGKSFCMKKIVGGVVDRGGSAFMIDHSDSAEWAIYSRSVVGSEIVDFKEPEISIDPLRIMGQLEGGEALQSFLAPLLSIDLRGANGTALSELLDPEYLDKHHIGSTPQLLEHMLSDKCEVAHAAEIGRSLRTFAQKSSPESFSTIRSAHWTSTLVQLSQPLGESTFRQQTNSKTSTCLGNCGWTKSLAELFMPFWLRSVGAIASQTAAAYRSSAWMRPITSLVALKEKQRS